MVAAPSNDPSFIRTPPVDLAVADEAGTKILVASRTGLQVVDSSAGGEIRATTYGGATVTAAYIDAALALFGNEKGEVFRWTYGQEGSRPELLNIANDGKPLAAISLTKFGQVWTCDLDGVCKFSAIARSVPSEQLNGSFKQPITKIAIQNGREILLSGEGNLLVANANADAPTLLTPKEFSKLSDFQASANGFVATSHDKLRLHQFDSTGKWIGTASLGPEHTEIVRFDGGESSYSILTKNGHLIAGVSGQPEVMNQVLASGELRSTQITPDGGTVIAETPEGVLHLSVGGNKSQKIKINYPLRLLAISPNGQTMIAAKNNSTECMQVNVEQPRVLFAMPTEIKAASAAGFSANGREMYLAGEDGGIYQISRNETSKANLLIKLETKPSALYLNSAGDRILVHAVDGRVTLLGLEGKAAKILFDSQDQKFSSATISGTRFLIGDANGALHELTENPAATRLLFNLGAASVVRLAGDATGEHCVIETADKQIHQVNLKDGVWFSSTTNIAAGDCLALCMHGNRLTRLDTRGNLSSVRASMAKLVLGPEATVRAIANTSDGRWFLAADARGKLARWPVSAEGLGKPQRCSIEVSVDDIRAASSGSVVCVLSKANGMVNYNVAQDRIAGGVKAKLESGVIAAVGLDQTVVIKQDKGYALADFRSGKVESLVAETTETAGLFQRPQDGNYAWLTASKSGEYRSAIEARPGEAGTGFQLGSKLKASSIRTGFLQVQANDTVLMARADGSQLTPFKLPGGQVVAVAMGSNPAFCAACDSTGSVWFFGEGAKAPKSVTLPGAPAISSIIWDTADANVAVATEKVIYVIDALTTKVRSKYMTQTPINSLVRWGSSGLWCVGKDQRLTKLSIAKTEWETRLPSASSVMAWHADGKEVVIGSDSGTLTAFDAKLGNQLTKIEIGKGQLRALCPHKSSDKLIMLAGTSRILSIDSAHRVAELPISSALQLSSIATDDTGRWIYATNNVGEVLAWDMTNLEATPKTIPCELRSSQIRFTEGGKLATIGNSRPALAFTPSTASQNALPKRAGLIEDFAILQDDSYVAIADGSSAIQLVGLNAENSKQLAGNSIGFRMVATHPRGLRIAAAGPVLGKPGAKLSLWDTADLRMIGEIELPANPIRLTYSSDGVLIAVATDDGGCQVYDGATGVLLESLPTSPGLNTVEFMDDGRRLLLAKQDGTITVQPLTSIGVVKASDVAITALNLHSSGKLVFTGDSAGRISLRAVDSLAQPKATFQGLTSPLLQMKLSSDSKILLAVYDDADHSVLVWRLDGTSGMPTSGAPDIVIRSPESRNTCAGFTIDSQYILLGGEDGLIRAWSVKKIARFRVSEGTPAQCVT